MEPAHSTERPRPAQVNFLEKASEVFVACLRKVALVTVVGPIVEGYSIEHNHPEFKGVVQDEVKRLPPGFFHLCIGGSDLRSSYSTKRLLRLSPEEIGKIPFHELSAYQISLCCQKPGVLENLSGTNLYFLCHFTRKDLRSFTDMDLLPIAPFLGISHSNLISVFTHFKENRSDFPTLPERILAAIEDAELRESLRAELQKPVKPSTPKVDERTPFAKAHSQRYT